MRADGKPYELPGAAQMIFSDLGTISVEKTRGFSAYRWIKDELVRMGVPPSEIAFMQDFKKSEAKQRLFGDVRAGKVRFLIGSSDTRDQGQRAAQAEGTTSMFRSCRRIAQRASRIERCTQHDVIDILPMPRRARSTRACKQRRRPASSPRRFAADVDPPAGGPRRRPPTSRDGQRDRDSDQRLMEKADWKPTWLGWNVSVRVHIDVSTPSAGDP